MATNIKALTMAKAMNPKVLGNATIALLNERLLDEYTAHFFYRNATNFCKGVGYNNAATFFAAEAANELTHAELLQNYMVDWNVTPTMPSVKPNIQFAGLIDIVNKAYLLEFDLFEKYNETSMKLFQHDLATFDFLQEFREIQKDSVVEFNDLINAANLVDKNDKFQILYFENTYF